MASVSTVKSAIPFRGEKATAGERMGQGFRISKQKAAFQRRDLKQQLLLLCSLLDEQVWEFIQEGCVDDLGAREGGGQF